MVLLARVWIVLVHRDAGGRLVLDKVLDTMRSIADRRASSGSPIPMRRLLYQPGETELVLRLALASQVTARPAVEQDSVTIGN